MNRYARIDSSATAPARVIGIIESVQAIEDGEHIDITDRPEVDEWSWYFAPAEQFVPPQPSPSHAWGGESWQLDAALEQQALDALLVALCFSIDTAADAARRAVAGDPLRAVEYDRAASEAQAFAASSYQGIVPPMVAAWAIGGRTAQQAADDILREAAQYNGALVQLRTVRLQAKEQIRTLMAANQVGQAQQIAEQTIAAIEAAVPGIGNAGA